MKIYHLLLIAIFLLSSTNKLFSANEKREAAQSKIKHSLNNFINLCRQKRYKTAYQYTTGKEKIAHKHILKQIHKNHGKVPKSISNYFLRLRQFNIDLVEIAPSMDKAIAITTFQFQYVDMTSRDYIRKERIVFYYIVKKAGKWLITHSKVKTEDYYYRSKSNQKWKRKRR